MACFVRERCRGWKRLKRIKSQVPSGAVALNTKHSSVGAAGSDRYICECLLERRVEIRVVPRNTLYVIRPCMAQRRTGIFYFKEIIAKSSDFALEIWRY